MNIQSKFKLLPFVLIILIVIFAFSFGLFCTKTTENVKWVGTLTIGKPFKNADSGIMSEKPELQPYCFGDRIFLTTFYGVYQFAEYQSEYHSIFSFNI